MRFEIREKVVLVTGASRGIGRAVAVAFAKRGARIVLAARSAEGLAAAEKEIREIGVDCVSVPADVTDRDAVAGMIDVARRRFGGIDLLVNNAGIGRVGRVDEGSFELDVRETLEASLFGMIHVTQAALPSLRERQRAAIVNMSSEMGRKAFARFGSYAVVMHAVSAVSDALRQELTDTRIQVSTIHPALTATDLLRDADESRMPPPFRHMTPLSPEAVAETVVDAVRRGKRRAVTPRVANMLLLAEAASPRLGDAVAWSLTIRPIARLLGMSRGETYHEVLRQKSPAATSG